MTVCDSSEPPATSDVATLRARIAELEAALVEERRLHQKARMQADALRNAEDALSTLFTHAPIGIVIGSLDDTLLRANRAFEQITGYTGDEVARLSVAAITCPEDNERELPLILDLLEGRRTHYQLEKHYIHKDGHHVPVIVTGLVVYDPAGAPTTCVALVEDVSERRRAEELRGYLAAILEATPDLVAYCDLGGAIQYLNRAWRQLYGLPDDVHLATLDPRRWQPAWVRQLVDGVAIPAAIRDGFWQGETVIVDAAGTLIPVHQTILALRGRDGAVARLATVLHDLRPQRQLAVERLVLERKLFEAQRLESLGMMAAGIAHDFNNILTTILGHTDLALQSPSLDQPVRQSLEAVLHGAHRASELTRQILAYAGKGLYAARATSLNSLIEGLAELRSNSVARGAAIVLDLATSLPAVEADAGQLHQALLNVVVNSGEAIEAARSNGEIRIVTAVEPLSRERLDGLLHGTDLAPGPYVRVTVADNGCGMDPATLERIFEPFFSTKFLGRGLGLAAVQGIVRVHRGAMAVESTLGIGTSFSFWLPVPSQSDAGAAAPGITRLNRRGSVLVVEPAQTSREQIACMVGSLGLTAVTADHASAALSRLAAGLPELLAAIVAAELPGLSADDVASAITSLRPETPVLVLGREVAQPLRLEALRAALARALGD